VIGGGATFDVSGLTTALTLASNQGLKTTGTTSTATLATASGKGLTTGSSSQLQFALAGSSVAPLTISGAGTVTLQSGNSVTVNTTSALGAGDYTLIAKGAGGTVAGTVPSTLSIGGSALASGMAGVLQITGGQLVLHVAAAGSLQFSASTYSDSETNADHTFSATVTRTGGSTGAVSVGYAVTAGTATAGSDYTVSPSTGTLTWADGDTASKSITITVKGDTTSEPDETVNFAISSPQGGATLGSPSSATLTITNDDTPTINVTGGPLTFPDTLVGSTSAELTYMVSGSSLTGDISVTAPSTDFEVSKTSGSGFGPSVTFTPTGGSVANSTVYVRFTPQSAGTKSGDITNASPGATTQNVAVSGTGFARLSGTYTVCSSGCDYATLTAAVADYNSKGVSGPVTFSLADYTYTDAASFGNETFPITINAAAGASAANTLTIKPASGFSPVISGSSATAVFDEVRHH
jgi:hypothetical protein